MNVFNVPAPTRQNLLDRLAKAAKHKMNEAEIAEQRASWVRGMSARCEHGELDFEQCAQCRSGEPRDL